MAPFTEFPYSGLPAFALAGRRTVTVARFIGLSTLTLGLAGLFLVPAGVLTTTGTVVVLVVTATTLPVAWLWFTKPWSGRFDTAYTVYAVTGITCVLFSGPSPFFAMTGVGLYALVATFVLHYRSRSLFIAYSAVTLLVLGLLSALAVDDGVAPWLVVSRAMTVVGSLVVPLSIYLYYNHLLGQMDRAQKDDDTGLLNRVGLEFVVAAEGDSYIRHGSLVALSIGVDGFDRIARDRGHDGPTGTVVDVARSLERILPVDAVLARTSTAGFAACMWVIDRRHGADLIGQLRIGLDELVKDRRKLLNYGYALIDVPDGPDKPHDVSGTVQRAIAAADLRRRGRIRGSSVTTTADRHEHTAARVRRVIEEGGPRIVFQPICRADDGQIVGYEALSRFAASDGNTESWFSDAEDTGFGVALDRAAITNALACARRLPLELFLTVNVNAATLIIDTDLVAAISDAGLHRKLVVEITEHNAIEEYDSLREAIARLRRSGVEIAIDDVGSGHSGLRQLVVLEPEMVKLDGFIAHGMKFDLSRQAAALGLLTFTRSVGARCVFEGIETADDLEAARAVGADLVQGYFLGHPTPVADID